MSDDSYVTIAVKHGLTPNHLDKVCAELYGILAAYEAKEIRAVTELIERGIPQRSRCKGAGR